MNHGPAPLWLFIASLVAGNLYRHVLYRASGLSRIRTRVQRQKKCFKCKSIQEIAWQCGEGAWALSRHHTEWEAGMLAGSTSFLLRHISLAFCLAAYVIYDGLKWAIAQKEQCYSTPGVSRPSAPLCFRGLLAEAVLRGGRGRLHRSRNWQTLLSESQHWYLATSGSGLWNVEESKLLASVWLVRCERHNTHLL